MKIRIKKNNKNIFENYNLIVEDTSAAVKQDTMIENMSMDKEFKKMAESTFIDAQKRKSLVTGIIMPSELMTDIRIPVAPADLRNVMQDMEVLKAEKQENNRGMLHDPIKTFNHAKDYANELFGSIDKLKFGKKSKDSIKGGEASKDVKKYESLEYLVGYGLNEGGMAAKTISLAAEGGAAAGKAAAVGGVASGVAMVTAGAGIGTGAGAFMLGLLAAAAEIMVTAAPAIITCVATGEFIGAHGDVNSKAREDDSSIHKSGGDEYTTKDLSDPKAIINPNVIENINNYINYVVDGTSLVLKDIAADKLDNATELKKKVNNLIALSDKQAEKYLSENAGIFKELAEKKKREVENELNSLRVLNQNLGKLQSDILKQLSDPKKFGVDKETVIDIQADIISLVSNTNDQADIDANRAILKRYSDAIKSKDPKEIIRVYQNRKSAIKESKLFEADNTDGDDHEIKPVDLTEYYKILKTEFETLIDPMFPLRGGENLPRVKNARTRMEGLITKATEEINTKIEQVCRIANSGDNSGLSGKMAAFVSKHPLRASTLKGEWSRHEDELKGRMEARLESMTNYDDPNYVVGWSAAICKTIVPEVLARMFTYRYALQLLINNDFYTFDSNLETKAKEEFNNSYSEIMANATYHILWALYQNNESYTTDGSELLKIDDSTEYGYSIDLEKTAYLIFLVYKIIGETRFYELDESGFIKGIIAVRSLYACKTVDQFVQNIEILCGADKIDITDVDKFETILEKFTCPSILNDSSKQIIENTYNYILGLQTNNVSEIDNKTTLVRVFNYPEILKKDIDIDVVIKLKDDYLTALKNKDNAKKNEVMKNIQDALGIDDPKKCPIGSNSAKTKDAGKIGYNEFIERIKSNKNSIDHYGLIMTIYYSFGLNDLFNNNDPMNTIEEVCRNVKNMLFLISSNVLNVGQELTIDMGAISAYIDACDSPLDRFESLLDVVNDVDKDAHKDELEKLYALCDSDDKLFKSFMEICANPKQAYMSNSNNGLLKFFKSDKKYGKYTPQEYTKTVGARINAKLSLDGMFTNENIKTLADLLKSKVEDLQFNSNDSKFRLQFNSIINNLNYLIVYTLVNGVSASNINDETFGNICRLYWDAEQFKKTGIYSKYIAKDTKREKIYSDLVKNCTDTIDSDGFKLSDHIYSNKGLLKLDTIKDDANKKIKDQKAYYTGLIKLYASSKFKQLYDAVYQYAKSKPFTL